MKPGVCHDTLIPTHQVILTSSVFCNLYMVWMHHIVLRKGEQFQRVGISDAEYEQLKVVEQKTKSVKVLKRVHAEVSNILFSTPETSIHRCRSLYGTDLLFSLNNKN